MSFELKICPKHGEVEHRVLKTGVDVFLSVCPACAGEVEKIRDWREKKNQSERERLSAAEIQTRINQRLSNAMIAPRFENNPLHGGAATFENFIADTPAKKHALESSWWFLDNLNTGIPGLIFLGRNGTGKNHLASAIVRDAVIKYGKTALITKVRKFDRAMKESWRKDGMESETLKLFCAPDILVLDEVGVQRGSETEILHVSELIDDRYEAMRPTILCGNITLADLKQTIGDRAVERFREGGRVVVFDWESYRRRGQIVPRLK